MSAKQDEVTAAVAASPSTELSLPERAIAAMKLQITAQQLTDLASKTADIISITNADGRKQAHAAAMALADKRIEIDKAGKAARDDANKFSKQVIVEKDRLIALIEPEEKRLLRLRDDWDAKIEAERLAKIEAEQKRIAAIRARIEEIKALPLNCANRPASQIEQAIVGLVALSIDASFQELQTAAEEARQYILTKLRQMFADRQAHEAEQERLRLEREELARQRAEQEEASRKERERIAAEQAAAAAQRKAELDAEIARQREQRELNQLRLKRIAHINGLVLVATTGRQGRKPGTRECITETLAEVRALLINETEFGDMLEAATAARDAAVQQIEHILQRFDDRIAENLRLEEEGRQLRERLRLQREEEQRLQSEREAAQAEHARIAEENARQAEELRRQQAELERQRQEQETARLELDRQQQAHIAATAVAAEGTAEPLAPAEEQATAAPEAAKDLEQVETYEACTACNCAIPARMLTAAMCERCIDLAKYITPDTAVYAITKACEVLGISDCMSLAPLLKRARRAAAERRAIGGAA
jgi:hypothetical protein